jgi:hypothetical protein
MFDDGSVRLAPSPTTAGSVLTSATAEVNRDRGATTDLLGEFGSPEKRSGWSVPALSATALIQPSASPRKCGSRPQEGVSEQVESRVSPGRVHLRRSAQIQEGGK